MTRSEGSEEFGYKARFEEVGSVAVPLIAVSLGSKLQVQPQNNNKYPGP
jgi:predicted permease